MITLGKLLDGWNRPSSSAFMYDEPVTSKDSDEQPSKRYGHGPSVIIKLSAKAKEIMSEELEEQGSPP